MDKLASQLKNFGEAQLANVSTHDIRTSTVHLILTAAFFTGAVIGMAKTSDTPKKTYLKFLYLFLEENFGLSANNATGMIESNGRLYKRYVLMEKIYNAGWQAAGEFCNAENQYHEVSDDLGYESLPEQNNVLKNLLYQYRDLSMSGLNIEGTKEQKPEAPIIEKPAPIVIKPVSPLPQAPRKRRTFLFLLIVLLGSLSYYYFILNPPTLKEVLEYFDQPFFIKMLEEAIKMTRLLIQ
ncbi:MAG: hypothetical protein COB30_004920 [Ectothiorhodospiraceae bacterium]|nr:hypothetical protein [Ectothiorhodospiraceae bacterium]